MGTFLNEMKKTNPQLAKDYAIVGNQSKDCLKHMVKALSLFPVLNTEADNERLAAAKRILKEKNRIKQ